MPKRYTYTRTDERMFTFNNPNGTTMGDVYLVGGILAAATICQMLEQAYARGVEDKGREIRERIGV